MHHHSIDHHKPSETLHVVAVVSNPVRYKSRYRLFQEFQQHMATQNVNLVVVESAFGARNFVCTEAGNPNHVQVRNNSELWLKENLINVGFSRLPVDWEYGAWIDGDIEFLNPNWVHDTLQALQHHRIVQMFQDCVDTGPTGEVIGTHRSFGYQYVSGAEMRTRQAGAYGGKTFPHPGFAWAIRRAAFDGIGGLVDFAILGAADHHMAWAFVGDVENSFPEELKTHGVYLDRLKTFQSRCEHFVQRDLGFTPGIIKHHWHGKKKDRRYVERWQILRDHHYDPIKDIKYNSHGVLELDGRNIGLRDGIRQYMRARNEDSIDLE